MGAKTWTCTRCGGLIQHVGAPPLPDGYAAGAWEGYFHLNKAHEHFMSVGWYDLKPHEQDGPAEDMTLTNPFVDEDDIGLRSEW